MEVVMQTVDELPEENRPKRNHYDWEGLAAQMQAQPGQMFHMLVDVPHRTVFNLMSGKVKAINPDEYQFTTRENHLDELNRQRCDLYGMYVGPTKEREG